MSNVLNLILNVMKLNRDAIEEIEHDESLTPFSVVFYSIALLL